MNLPDAENLCLTLGQQLQELIISKELNEPLLVGIHTGGVWVAQRLQKQLNQKEGVSSLDISFYRDDFTRKGLHPKVKGSNLLESLEGRHVILIDDVIMSGRTIRAAMNELFDYGRPGSIHLICLLDIGQRELPIQPDLSGLKLDLEKGQQIKLHGPNPLTLSFA